MKRKPIEENVTNEEPAVTSVGVLVLGMHRTGTSVVTNLLAELGCDLGGPTVGAQPDNPRGYWEHQDVTAIHEEFLRRCGRTWSDPRPFRSEDFQGSEAADARDKLAQVLVRDMLPKPLWIVKDPRMCRLMGLWRDLIERLGFEARVVHTVRSPYSVAESLLARDGIPPWKSHLLWLRHSLEAEFFSRGYPRAVLHMESLERFPQAEIRRLCAVLGLADRLDLGRLADVASRVFARELVHHRVAADEAGQRLEIHPWVAGTYASFHALGRGDEEAARAELDRVREELDRADGLLIGDPSGWELELHGERYTRLLKEMQRYDTLVTVQRDEVDAARREIGVLHEQGVVAQEVWTALRGEVKALRDHVGSGFTSIEQKHVELLGRSLDFAARLEARWTAVSAERDQALAERDQALVELSQALAERDQALAERDQALAERGEALVQRDQALSERDQAMARRDEESLQRELCRRECEKAIAQRYAVAEALRETSEERDAAFGRNSALLEELERLKERHAAEVRERSRIEVVLHRTISTKSWRYTAPLRSLLSVVRRPRKDEALG